MNEQPNTQHATKCVYTGISKTLYKFTTMHPYKHARNARIRANNTLVYYTQAKQTSKIHLMDFYRHI